MRRTAAVLLLSAAVPALIVVPTVGPGSRATAPRRSPSRHHRPAAGWTPPPGPRSGPGRPRRRPRWNGWPATVPRSSPQPLGTAGYSLVGVTWDADQSVPVDPADLLISVRTRPAESWQPWTVLATDSGDGPAEGEGVVPVEGAADGVGRPARTGTLPVLRWPVRRRPGAGRRPARGLSRPAFASTWSTRVARRPTTPARRHRPRRPTRPPGCRRSSRAPSGARTSPCATRARPTSPASGSSSSTTPRRRTPTPRTRPPPPSAPSMPTTPTASAGPTSPTTSSSTSSARSSKDATAAWTGRSGRVPPGASTPQTWAVSALGNYVHERSRHALVDSLTNVVAWKAGISHLDPSR